jgi:hypothetical protein
MGGGVAQTLALLEFLVGGDVDDMVESKGGRGWGRGLADAWPPSPEVECVARLDEQATSPGVAARAHAKRPARIFNLQIDIAYYFRSSRVYIPISFLCSSHR